MAMREVEGEEQGTFFRFDKLGDKLVGTLEKERTDTSGKFGPQQVFDVRQESGELLTASGTWDLKSKLAKVPIGSYVEIEYVNDKDTGVNRDGSPKSPMKVFRVAFDDGQKPAVNGTEAKAPF